MRFAISCCRDDIKMKYVIFRNAVECFTERFAVHVCARVCLLIFLF